MSGNDFHKVLLLSGTIAMITLLAAGARAAPQGDEADAVKKEAAAEAVKKEAAADEGGEQEAAGKEPRDPVDGAAVKGEAGSEGPGREPGQPWEEVSEDALARRLDEVLAERRARFAATPAGAESKVAEETPAAPRPDAPPAADEWATSTVPLVVGGGFTVIGLAMGIAYTVIANGQRDEIAAMKVGDGGRSECHDSVEARCMALRTAVASFDESTLAATAGFVMGAVSAAATTAFVLFVRPRLEAQPAVSMAPWVTPVGGGLGVRGQF